MLGSATFTMVLSSITMNSPKQQAPRVSSLTLRFSANNRHPQHPTGPSGRRRTPYGAGVPRMAPSSPSSTRPTAAPTTRSGASPSRMRRMAALTTPCTRPASRARSVSARSPSASVSVEARRWCSSRMRARAAAPTGTSAPGGATSRGSSRARSSWARTNAATRSRGPLARAVLRDGGRADLRHTPNETTPGVSGGPARLPPGCSGAAGSPGRHHGKIEGGSRLLVEDYAERVKGCAQYLTRLLADQGTRVDNPVDEPIGPEESAPLELADDRGIVRFGVDAAPGVTAAAIDGGSFWVIAYRAGTVWHRDRVTIHEDPAPLTVEALTQTDAKGRYAQALAAAGVVRERELADLGGVVDVLRELAEWRRARDAIERAAPGDVVLVDGSLHPGAFLPAALVVPIHELALERGIDLVGVTKASKLRWGRYAPLVLRVRRRAAPRCTSRGWPRAARTRSGSTPCAATASPTSCSPCWPACPTTRPFSATLTRWPASTRS